MSRVIYNGIELKIVQTRVFAREAVYSNSGEEYLYTKFTLDVRCVYNPKATSVVSATELDDGKTSNTTTTDDLQRPVLTDIAIRHHLMQPRRVLEVIVGDTSPKTLLLSPPWRQYLDGNKKQFSGADANNGPRPISCNVTQISGSKTFLVEFRVETWLNECAPDTPEGRPQSVQGTQDASRLPAILTHRWTMQEIVDEQFLSTRIIRGYAKFRADVLREREHRYPDKGHIADDFRFDLAHDIPPYFRRTNVQVDVSEDGTTLNYVLVDKEQVLSLGRDSSSVKIDGTLACEMGPVGSDGKSAMTIIHTHLRAVGDRSSLKFNMLQQLIDIGWGRLLLFNQNVILLKARVMQSLFDKHVELELSCIFPGAQAGTASNVAGMNFPMPFPLELFGVRTGGQSDQFVQDDSILWKYRSENTQTGEVREGVTGFFEKATTDNPTPWEQCRGYSLGRIYANIFKGTCDPRNRPNQPTHDLPRDRLGDRGAIRGVDILDSDETTELTIFKDDYITPGLLPTEYSPAETEQPHTDYKIDVKYESATGVMMTPVASNPTGDTYGRPQASAIQVSSPFGKKVVRWTAERIGLQPVIPDSRPVKIVNPNTGELHENEVLLRVEVQPATQELMADGVNTVTRISGTYIYGLKRPFDPATDLAFYGHLPYDKLFQPSQGDAQNGVLQWAQLPAKLVNLTDQLKAFGHLGAFLTRTESQHASDVQNSQQGQSN